MDKKKLQEFLAKLQEMASELNEMKDSDTSNKNETAPEANQATVYVETSAEKASIQSANDSNHVVLYDKANVWFETRTQRLDDDERITYDNSTIEVRDNDIICDSEIFYNVPSSIPQGTIVSKKLALTVSEGTGQIKVDGTTVSIYEGKVIEIAVSGSGSIKLEPTYRDTNAYAEFYTSGSYAPRIVIDYEEADTGDEPAIDNSFYTILVDGEVCNQVTYDRPFDVVFKDNANITATSNTAIKFYGRTKMQHTFKVYSLQTGELFGEYTEWNSTYNIPVSKLLAKTGSPNFRFVLKNGDDSIYLQTAVLFTIEYQSLEIIKSPDRVKYNNGEYFDKRGMRVGIRYTSGELEEINDYEVHEDYQLVATDKYIKVKYNEMTCQQPIEVITDHEFAGIYFTDISGNFIKMTLINGHEPVFEGTNIEAWVPGGVGIEVDLNGYLASQGTNINQIDGCTLVLAGRVRSASIKPICCVYAYDSNKRICDVWENNTLYYIPVKRIYDETGTANFRLFIENEVRYADKSTSSYAAGYPHEIFSLFNSFFTLQFGDPVALEVRKPAHKTKYVVGEKFNSSGMEVYCTYEYGAVRKITDYTVVDAHRELQPYDKEMVITYEGVSTSCTIEVDGQHINLTKKIFKRIRNQNEWGNWSEIGTFGQNTVYVNRTESEEYKTVITFNKSLVEMGGKTKTGLRLSLDCTSSSSSYYGKHIKVNQVSFTIPSVDDEVYFYIGNLKNGDSGTMQVELEYVDAEVTFSLPSGANIYNCSPLDPTIQSEKKSYELTGGASLTLDILQGSHTLIINDIDAESTLLGVGVSHVYNPLDGNMNYGKNFRLNLYERLEFTTAMSGPVIQTPLYTDAVGNKYTFSIIYYVYVEGEKQYLNDQGIAQIERNSEGELYFEGYQVYIDYIKVGNFRYLKSINSTINNNSKYQQLLLQNNADTLPVHWIKADNLYKGFNAAGQLVLMIDEFGHYTELSYNTSTFLTKVADGNGNYINFVYQSNGGLLEKIADSRGRRIEYAYDSNECLSLLNYYDALSGGTNYKTIKLEHVPVIVEGVDTFAISKILFSDNTYSKIEYDQASYFLSRVANITHYSYQPGVENTDNDGTKISSLRFEYKSDGYETDIIDDDENQEKYIFTSSGQMIKYYQILNYLVSKAETYSYTPFEKRTTIKVANEFLNRYSYSNFNANRAQEAIADADKNENIVIELNNYNMPVKTTQRNVYLTDTSSKQVVTEYEYDDELKTTKETSTETYYSGEYESYSYKYETLYTYDDATQLLRKKVQNIFKKTGKAFVSEQTATEEYEYDEYGCLCETKSYRTATGSSESNNYYSTKEYNSNKLPVKEYDETGLYHSAITYKNGTNLVSKVTAPDNNILNYNYDNLDRVTKMWGTAQSTENANTSAYVDGEVQSLNHSGNNAIGYSYDSKRRPIKITYGTTDYEQYSYTDDYKRSFNNYDVAVVVNANNEKFKAEAEIYGSEEQAYYNDTRILIREYNQYGNLHSVKDYLVGTEEYFFYDTCGNITTYRYVKGTEKNEENYSYNVKGQKTKIVYTGKIDRTDMFSYSGKAVDYLTKVTTGEYTVLPEQDIDERYTGKTVKIGTRTVDEESVTYIKEDDHATHMPSGITYPDTSLSYTYDGNGNIKKIMQSGVLYAQYEYDTLGRLIREDNKAFNKSYFYTYDNNGNIIAKESCAFTTGAHTVGTGDVTSYTYSKDKMTRFGNQTCVYDSVGNPTTYRGKTATWVRGRKLASFDGNTFEYNAQGIRIKKNGITYIYDSQGRLLKQSNGLEFFYDANGLVGLKYNGENYVYRTDIQGNIIAILDSDGDVVVEYKYDAWGNQFATGNSTLASINPFRYRSYYFDTETGLYYLQTRYYDPEVGRFLNIDSLDYADPETINGLNLYAYCNNNPILYVDPTGHAWWHWLVAAAVVVALAAATVVTAGGVVLGATAISAATIGTTAVGASAVTTTLAYATVGAGVALAASGIYAGITATENGVKSGSASNAFNTFSDYGETALYSTIAGGLYGAGSGMLTYYEQIGNSKQSGFMTSTQRGVQRKAYWRGLGNKDGKASPGMEINHIYGTYGNNRNYFIVQSKSEHIAFHKKYGFKTSGGSFSRLNPFYHNWWNEVKKLLGV